MKSLVKAVGHHPDVIWDVIDGAVTVCHTGTGAFYRFNESAAVIWQALGEGNADAAVRALENKYPELDLATAQRVVEDFISSMQTAGLIDVAGASMGN